ncbi:TPA: LPS export ABC transporter ATP-binding protein [bacterium]|nr:LPS export ABC transporter ATP-binding protein [bacterium]
MKLVGEKITKYYKDRAVVDGVSIEVGEDEIVGLLGPNGAGKTTTFYSIIGLIEPDRGKIMLDGEDINNLPIYKRARKGLGFLPQEPSIFESLTVRENLTIILEFIEEDKFEREKKITSLLSEFGLLDFANNKAGTLSGGERRRLEIARVLSINPKFLLLDEPFTGIDPIKVSGIQEIIKHLKDKGVGVLITDHNVRETLKITDRSYIISDGKVLFEGSSIELINNPKVREIYLGNDFSL